MRVRLKDTQTGEEREIEGPYRPFAWHEGNYSCDCNRAGFFDQATVPGVCLGATRYVVLWADDPNFSRERFNQDYLEALYAT